MRDLNTPERNESVPSPTGPGLFRHAMQGRVRGLRRQIKLALRRGRGEEGASIAEFAVASTILLAIVFGIYEASSALYAYTYISDAAREATRYAIVRGSACTGFTECSGTPVGATSAQISSYVKGLGYPGINSSNLNVNSTWPTTGSACTPISSPCNNPGNLVKVVVAYQYPLSIPFVPLSTINMSSTSEMVISQ
jgi:Flp pilus assembly protein TadG